MAPGATQRVQIGGTGRPLVGRVALEGPAGPERFHGALARVDDDDAPARDECARKRVTMPVLVRDLTGRSRQVTLAGEFEVGAHRIIHDPGRVDSTQFHRCGSRTNPSSRVEPVTSIVCST